MAEEITIVAVSSNTEGDGLSVEITPGFQSEKHIHLRLREQMKTHSEAHAHVRLETYVRVYPCVYLEANNSCVSPHARTFYFGLFCFPVQEIQLSLLRCRNY